MSPVTQTELAGALGISVRTVKRWTAARHASAGATGSARTARATISPRVGNGRPNARHKGAATGHGGTPETGDTGHGPPILGPRAVEKRELTPAEGLAKAKATDIEIKLHQKKGVILSKAEVETEWVGQGRAVRAAMLEVPAAVAIRYPGPHKPLEVSMLVSWFLRNGIFAVGLIKRVRDESGRKTKRSRSK